MNRRSLLLNGGTLAAGLMLTGPFNRAAANGNALAALSKSPLIYQTTLKRNGQESACQAEVWFASQGSNIYVVTAVDAWRSQAVTRGLTRSRIWVGDMGQWKDTDGGYRSLPMMEADGSFETNKTVQADVLALFGRKYSDEWGTWGPRFRRGLNDGSRVMLKYRVL
jgi:hypothetical protein